MPPLSPSLSRFWLLSLVAMLMLVLPARSQAQDMISNTAWATWREQDQVLSTTSNTVTFAVEALPISLQTLRYLPDGTSSFSVSLPRCGQRSMSATGARTTLSLNGSLLPSDSFRIGELLYVKISAAAANVSPTTADQLDIKMTTSSGDEELVTISETGADTGDFMAAIATTVIPPAPTQRNCQLSVHSGDTITIEIADKRIGLAVTPTSAVQVLADPYGLVFDSTDGTPINGVAITLVDEATGQPARVFADDALTAWPSTVISGQPVTDASGTVHPMPAGEYRFPLAPLGRYRLQIKAPAGYTTPSLVPREMLAEIERPEGGRVVLSDASFGGTVALASPEPVRVDIPVDSPSIALGLAKTASRDRANPGDLVVFTLQVTNPNTRRALYSVVVKDRPSRFLRFVRASVRIDGRDAAGSASFAGDGSEMVISLGRLGAGQSAKITYAMILRSDAPAGIAANRAELSDERGLTSVSEASVRIEDEVLASRMTLIGRVTSGDCSVTAPRPGIPGVRIMLEDGSFAVTDADGRYHFEGLAAGTHVVQLAPQTLPEGSRPVECARSTRSSGNATSRFVTGQGGSLAVADFAATAGNDPAGRSGIAAASRPTPSTAVALSATAASGSAPTDAEAEGSSLAAVGAVADGAVAERATEAPANYTRDRTATIAADNDDRQAAGAATDWLAQGDGPTGFLFPLAEHNPRSPAIRIVIRHRKGERVELTANGKPVDPVAFDGVTSSSAGFAVSTWRGVPLENGRTTLGARVLAADNALVTELSRDVHFVEVPARATIVPEQSRLVADGRTRPVLAIRITDRSGRPVHAGISGELSLNQPYESAVALEALQQRTLSGLDRASPSYVVKGDDGIALVELAPTMVSGPLRATLQFKDATITRRQVLESWIAPGEQQWTLVGLAEAASNHNSIARQMQRTGRFDSDLGENARVAFYAKGRILGKLLLTASYDSAKQKDQQRLLGAIDPNAYYTVFADGSSRRFDAASREKLYVRLEARAFYAIYGDFVTGFDQTLLARYQRTVTGATAEGTTGNLHVQAFAARSGDTHRRDEIQGGGISGPYRLSSRRIVANSDIVTLQVRDRFRSEVIVASRTLERFVDYDIDLIAGTISFRAPVLSRDDNLNPRFIVVDYETETASGGALNAALRGDVTMFGGALRVGATAITDTGNAGVAGRSARANLGALDLKAALGQATELRAEAALSEQSGKTATAWIAEVEHHEGALDALGYVRSADRSFGLGQLNGAEQGRRKIGFEGRYRLGETLAITARAWLDTSLTDNARRLAGDIGATWHSRETEARVGLAMFDDHLADGRNARTTALESSATRRLFDNRLEINGAASIALGRAQSIDLPSRYRLGAAYSFSSAVKLLSSYERAAGAAVSADTLRAGFEVGPWEGARIVSSLGSQTISEFGKRSFAAFGLTQSLAVTATLTIDATVDHATTLAGVDATRLINRDHPAASGGNLGEAGTIAEDFTAITAGATWRYDRWSVTGRGEIRNGQLSDRRGVILGIIRQLGEGSMAGTGVTITHAREITGQDTRIIDAALSLAHRPADSAVALLSKLELRSDKISGGDAGLSRTSLVTGTDATSTRLMASTAINWSPRHGSAQRSEVGLFAAIRHTFDAYEGFNLAGTSLIGGIDARVGIGPHVEIGAVASLRYSLTVRTVSFALGPQVSFSPAKDTLITLGYNISGYRDPDFGEARQTAKGPYVALRLKFDSDSLAVLGLRR